MQHARAPREESDSDHRDDDDDDDERHRFALAVLEPLARLARESLELVFLEMLAFSSFHDS